jgi:hypothetical protein
VKIEILDLAVLRVSKMAVEAKGVRKYRNKREGGQGENPGKCELMGQVE